MKYLIYVLSFLTLSFKAKCEVGSCAKGFENDDSESFASGANDIIVVEQDDGTLKSTILNVQALSVLENLETHVLQLDRCSIKL